MDGDRSHHEHNLAAGRTYFTHHVRDAGDAHFNAAFGRDLVRHEREAVPIALAELRHDADAVVAADDAIALQDVAQLATACGAVLNHDHGVHALVLHFYPASADSRVGAMFRRRIEILSGAAVL